MRTVDPHHIPTTTTSSSFVGILQHDNINISAMRRLLFTSLCEYASRRTRDVMYRLLTDASPYGVRCCKRSCTKGKCDLCWYLQDTHVAESTHHVHHECIYSQLVTVGILRGFIEATGDDDERTRTRRSTTAQLASQHRRALETGLLLADGPAERQGSAVWHELIAATHFVLEKRRNRNAYFATPLAYDATDAYRDARALAQTVATGLRILALAETEWIQIHYNNWLPEDGKSPIDKWTAAWIETGAAEVHDFELVDEATFRIAPCVAPGLRLGTTVLGGKHMTGLFAARRFDKCACLGVYTGTPMLGSDFDGTREKIARAYAYGMKEVEAEGTKLSFVIVPPLLTDGTVDLKRFPLAAMNEPPPGTVANVVMQQMIVSLEQMQKTGAPSDIVEPITMLLAYTTRRVEPGEQLFLHYGGSYQRTYPVGNPSNVQCSNEIDRLFPSGVPWSCVVKIPRDLLDDEEDSGSDGEWRPNQRRRR